jgi:hypothetical protein
MVLIQLRIDMNRTKPKADIKPKISPKKLTNFN